MSSKIAHIVKVMQLVNLISDICEGFAVISSNYRMLQCATNNEKVYFSHVSEVPDFVAGKSK